MAVSAWKRKLRQQRKLKYREIHRKRSGQRPIQPGRTVPSPPGAYSEEEQRLWRLIDGAVIDAFKKHPEYLTDAGRRVKAAQRSVAKRVLGAIRASRKRRVDRVSTPATDIEG